MNRPNKKITIREEQEIVNLLEALEFKEMMVDRYGGIAEDPSSYDVYGTGYDDDFDVYIKFSIEYENTNYEVELDAYNKYLVDENNRKIEEVNNAINELVKKNYSNKCHLESLLEAVKDNKSIPNLNKQIEKIIKTSTDIQNKIIVNQEKKAKLVGGSYIEESRTARKSIALQDQIEKANYLIKNIEENLSK
jgi:predicted ester cyclase